VGGKNSIFVLDQHMSAPTAIEEKLGPRVSRRGEPTWEIAYLYPSQGTWSEEEYLALDTNHLIEYVGGCLEFPPMPDLFHQKIVKFLFLLLDKFVAARALGEVYFAPLRIRVAARKIREPDIVFLRRDRLADLHAPVKGADLAMEVVSGGAEDRERDLKTKAVEYARAGIQEYWIVDPQQRLITVLTLKGKSYRQHGAFASGSQATSVLLAGFFVSVDEVFAAGEGRV
jgi:Uma2 family endonuclease